MGACAQSNRSAALLTRANLPDRACEIFDNLALNRGLAFDEIDIPGHVKQLTRMRIRRRDLNKLKRAQVLLVVE